MVFFTSLLICLIIYYLHTDGLIYVTIIAVAGELINIFMSQTMARAAEKKSRQKFSKIVDRYKSKITAQKKKITELEKIQDDSVRKVYIANKKVKEYEERLGIKKNDQPEPEKSVEPEPAPESEKPDKNKEEPAGSFNDLPAGSNRKGLPI